MNLAQGWLLAHRATSSSYCLKMFLVNGNASKIAKDCFFRLALSHAPATHSQDFRSQAGTCLARSRITQLGVCSRVCHPAENGLIDRKKLWVDCACDHIHLQIGKRKHFPDQTLPDQNIPHQTSVITCHVTKKDEFLVQPDFCMQTLGLVITINK